MSREDAVFYYAVPFPLGDHFVHALAEQGERLLRRVVRNEPEGFVSPRVVGEDSESGM